LVAGCAPEIYTNPDYWKVMDGIFFNAYVTFNLAAKESLVEIQEITVEWKKYDNFFSLWNSHRDDTQLIYVIGESHHCYIGSIGPRDGKKGLGTRYQWQYVNRARAIFGLDESSGQVAFAGILKKTSSAVQGIDILAVEAEVQNAFVLACGPANALFDPEDLVNGCTITYGGEPPSFLGVNR